MILKLIASAALALTLFIPSSSTAEAPIAPNVPAPIIKNPQYDSSEPVECSCIAYLTSLGIKLPLGDAIDITPNSTPHVGGIALFTYGKLGHVALITAISTSTFTIIEANYHRCTSDTRIINWNDKHLQGFYSSVVE